MSNIKFIYDEKDIKDIKVLFVGDSKDIKESVHDLCINTIPESFDPEVIDEGDSLLIKSNDGRSVLIHILKYFYLITCLLKKLSDSGKLGDGKELVVEDLDPALIHEEIDSVQSASIEELTKLIGGTFDEGGEDMFS